MINGEPDLRHHGDADAGQGLVDLAVNVRAGMPPDWLRERLVAAIDDVAAYPDVRPATEAIAARHGRPVEQVLPTAGGAEAFTLLARAFPPAGPDTPAAPSTAGSGHRPAHDARFARVRRAVVVHPQFTEPEVALVSAGHAVDRVVLTAESGFTLDPDGVPDDADLVVIGNPTNPTSVLHPAASIERLARPGRILVVDEAFMDAVPGEAESLAARSDLLGLVVLRSLTKTWGLAGVRAGYVLGPVALIERLASVQPPWSVSSLAIEAMRACMQPSALAEAEEMARTDGPVREWFAEELRRLGGEVVPHPRAPFVLVRFPGSGAVSASYLAADGQEANRDDWLRGRLREAGWAVRRGDTFPGLGPDWIRIALRDRPTLRRFLDHGLAPALQPWRSSVHLRA